MCIVDGSVAMSPLFPELWTKSKLSEISFGVSTNGKKVKTQDLMPIGKYKVIDQSASKSPGFLNDVTRVIKATKDNPVILFGDHTRVVKYIDHDFIPGADGTKLFRAEVGIDPRYLRYLVESADIPDRGYSRHYQYLSEVEFSIAPAAEQTRIANQLDTLLTRIQACNDRFDAIPALLKRFRQTVLDAALNGGLSTEMVGLSPRKSFPKVRLSEVAESRLGKMLDKQKNSGTPTPYIGNINVRWFSFNLENLQFISIEDREKSGLEIRDGDVFICEGGEPGRCAIWNMGPTNIVFQKALHRVRPVKGRLLSQWLAYCIRHMTDTEQLKPLYTGTTIQHLTGASLSKIVLPLPSVEEQAEIVRRVEALFALADRLEARCTAARTHAQRLTPLVLAKAFRGELVPQDPNDEPASALLARIALSNMAGAGRNKQKVPVALKECVQAAIN